MRNSTTTIGTKRTVAATFTIIYPSIALRFIVFFHLCLQAFISSTIATSFISPFTTTYNTILHRGTWNCPTTHVRKLQQQLKMNTNPSTSTTTSLKKNEESIAIVGVKCTKDENPILKSGVVELFQLYFKELYELKCDLGFQGFQTEWTDLPGKYDFRTKGGLFVALSIPSTDDTDGLVVTEDSTSTLQQLHTTSQVIGCIAIRPLSEGCGEVKRMYIRESYRRRGVGKLLANVILNYAFSKECQYTELKLDSLERLVGAVKLYEDLGFERMKEPYCECPEHDHVCMNLLKAQKEEPSKVET